MDYRRALKTIENAIFSPVAILKQYTFASPEYPITYLELYQYEAFFFLLVLNVFLYFNIYIGFSHIAKKEMKFLVTICLKTNLQVM